MYGDRSKKFSFSDSIGTRSQGGTNTVQVDEAFVFFGSCHCCKRTILSLLNTRNIRSLQLLLWLKIAQV